MSLTSLIIPKSQNPVFQIYNYTSNGCGCQTGILRWFKPPYAKQFESACAVHDYRYNVGGTPSDRKEADKELFHNMMKRTLRTEHRPLRMWFMTCVALTYYAAVRIFGKFYFNNTKTEEAKVPQE